MPYSVRHANGEWEVYNSASGQVLGTHPSEHDAQSQIRAFLPDTKAITMRAGQLESLIRHYEEIYE